MRGRILTLLLFALPALAQTQAYPDGYLSPGSPSSGIGLGGTPLATTSALNLFVDCSLGSDSNACTASGTSACLTVQGAVNKIPKFVRDPVTVTVAAGTCNAASSAAYIMGFTTAVRNAAGATSSTAPTINIKGSRTTATVSAGLSSGSIASAVQGSTGAAGTAPGTWGTVTVNSSGWTTNNLQGFWLNITGGSGAGQVRVITANTNAANGVITIAGGFDTVPDATSTFEIDDCAVTLTTGGASLPFGLLPNATDPIQTPAAGASSTLVIGANSNRSSVSPTIGLQDICFSAPLGHGDVFLISGSVYELRVKTTNGANRKLAKNYSVGGNLMLDNVIFAISGFQDRAIQVLMGSAGTNTWAQDTPPGITEISNVSMRRSAIFMANDGVSIGVLDEGGATLALQQNEISGGHEEVEIGGAGMTSTSSTGNHYDTTSAAEATIDLAISTDALGTLTVGFDGDVFNGPGGAINGVVWKEYYGGIVSFGGDVTTFNNYQAAFYIQGNGVKILATAVTSAVALPTITGSTCEYSLLNSNCTGVTQSKATIEAQSPKAYIDIGHDIWIMEYP